MHICTSQPWSSLTSIALWKGCRGSTQIGQIRTTGIGKQQDICEFILFVQVSSCILLIPWTVGDIELVFRERDEKKQSNVGITWKTNGWQQQYSSNTPNTIQYIYIVAQKCDIF